MGPSWLLLWRSGSLQAEAGASQGGGMGRGRNFAFLPICSHNTGVWGAPQNETSTTQAALHPESEPLELTPGRGTQIHYILILSKLCKTPITEHTAGLPGEAGRVRGLVGPVVREPLAAQPPVESWCPRSSH